MSTGKGTRKRAAKETADENGPSASKKLLNSVENDYSDFKDIKEKYNLKIVSWNVAGIRACIKKGLIEYLKKEDADVICLNVSNNE